MARKPSPDSVSTKVSKLSLGETIKLSNPYTSVAVMVSLLKKKEENNQKIFKISFKNNKTFVLRVK